ncbi:DNA (cytosine-5)-methyltransferase CMT3 isoform X2 [Ziziphus jujuba]|uniref:DNA (cytosine-5-)-methyltransferase n=1 Tax=Ziziphus jujuba TaxID=326968 RepID=A0ABM3IG27_ZIZJJ|nr:DNA (cytosine-5)-methyltransferase CMT3 isoform X2 [Ziziphus jujuba]
MPKKRKTITMPKSRKAKSTAASSSSSASSSLKTASSSKRLKRKEELRNEEAQDCLGVADRSDESYGSEDESQNRFVGEQVPPDDARRRWPERYQEKKKKQVVGSKISKDKPDSDEEVIQARCHYTSAEVDGRVLYNLYDDAHVKAGQGEPYFICKIVEMFEAIDGELYFTAQWYYRARDTVIKDCAVLDPKRVFYSEVQDPNPLNCLIEKINIVRLPLNVDLDTKRKSIPACDYYCDTFYLLPYHTFTNLPADNKSAGSETSSTISSEIDINGVHEVNSEPMEEVHGRTVPEVTLLDIYSGCGAMSTGLCLGAHLSGLNLVTRWAVDLNEHAINSLKLNHPETEVRNELAEDFLSLLKEWQKLCVYFNLVKSNGVPEHELDFHFNEDDEDEEDEGSDNDKDDGEDSEIFEVEKVLAICYGDPKETGDRGLYVKVHWKGYGADEDSWEPINGMGNCKEAIKQFVTQCFKSRSLPLPGDVDVICGGPPCQGISGFNRFRDKDNPLRDEKNKQLIVFMDLVQFLKPKLVLMENVVDLVKFADGFLGRYAMGRLVDMNYQARMGMMAAGAYGLPQFRMRVFLWGAQPAKKLPSYPLPTHDLVVRGVIPIEFETCTVAYDEGHHIELERKLLLEDAISDLPAVGNYEKRDEMLYGKPAVTDFQRLIRLSKDETLGSPNPSKQLLLHDHRPLELNADDYERVCRVPKKKGANFRDFPGVRVRPDNKVEWDPDVERVYLDSGKPLVPDYAMSFVNGSSSKPFARLWWDETVPTVVTRAEPHNQAIIHPEQDRVLTIRENARLQGFPDHYKLCGPVKERYIQVGNAVAVPVSRALGYALGLAIQGSGNDEPLFTLPPKFPDILARTSAATSEENN